MRKTVSLLLCIFMLPMFMLTMPVKADFKDFPDVEGHWAYKSLKKAYNDGIIKGYTDNTMKPDRAITAAELFTIVTRVLRSEHGQVSEELGLSGKEWFAKNVSAAYEMGLIDSVPDFNAPIKRQDAFYALAVAFQLAYADPDETVLDGFKDAGEISEKNRAAMASLVQDGLVKGVLDNKLAVNENMTRAEFVTMIYRFVDSVGGGTVDGGRYVMPNEQLKDKNADKIWISGDNSDIDLENVSANLIAIRSNKVSSSSIKNVTAERFAVAPVGAYEFTPDTDCDIKTISVGGAGDKITIGTSAPKIEVTSTGRKIEINGDTDLLVIGGSGNTVTVNSSGVDKIIIVGKNNNVILNCRAETVSVKKGPSDITGSGSIGVLEKRTSELTCSLSVDETKIFGLAAAEVTLTLPKKLPAGETLHVTARIDGGEPRTGYVSYWTFNGNKSKEFSSSLSVKQEYEYEYTYTYTYSGMPTTGTIEFTIVDKETGESKSASATFEVENYPDEYYYEKDVLSMVTTGYKGNWTLEWAKNNDYPDIAKEMWVNKKGYESNTKYLIWVSIAYQRCNIFEKKGDKWSLVRSSIVATGAPSSPTPVGVYKTTYKQTGWYTAKYTCYPIVRFWEGSGYAFHSRLYEPGSKTVLQDSRIGYPISLGCIRMYNEDVQWIYDNIPTKTTVVIF